MIKPFHPDDSGMIPKSERNPKPKPRPDGNGGQGLLAAFQPGGLGLLSQQLNTGFGGGQKNWQASLRQAYSPMHMPQPFQYSKVRAAPVGDGSSGEPGGPKLDDLPVPSWGPIPDTQGSNAGGGIATLGGKTVSPQLLAALRQRLAQRG